MGKTTRTITTFKELRNALEQTGSHLKTRPHAKKVQVQERPDDDIFREAMADVREIREFRDIPFTSPKGVKPYATKDEDVRETLTLIVQKKRAIRLSDTGEYMEWSRPGARKNIAKQLHEGCFSVQDTIDLHGMTVPEAEAALIEFFREALKRRLFCVKVIHGRGLRSPFGPVLKEAMKKLLHGSLSKWILAYATAKNCDGGLGATYIILSGR